MEKYKSMADDLKSKSEGLEAQVLTLKKVSNPLIKIVYVSSYGYGMSMILLELTTNG